MKQYPWKFKLYYNEIIEKARALYKSGAEGNCDITEKKDEEYEPEILY